MPSHKFVVRAHEGRASALLSGLYVQGKDESWLHACELTTGVYECEVEAAYYFKLASVMFYPDEPLADPLRIDPEVFKDNLEYNMYFESVDEYRKFKAHISAAATTFRCEAVFPEEDPKADVVGNHDGIFFNLIGVDPQIGDLLEAIAQAYRP